MKGGMNMYYYGGGSCGCPQGYPTYQMPYCSYGGYNGGSSYAIVLVLFILLVIVIGSRANR